MPLKVVAVDVASIPPCLDIRRGNGTLSETPLFLMVCGRFPLFQSADGKRIVANRLSLEWSTTNLSDIRFPLSTACFPTQKFRCEF
jgi:hypothetical protein